MANRGSKISRPRYYGLAHSPSTDIDSSPTGGDRRGEFGLFRPFSNDHCLCIWRYQGITFHKTILKNQVFIPRDEYLTFKYSSFMHNGHKVRVHLKFDSVVSTWVKKSGRGRLTSITNLVPPVKIITHDYNLLQMLDPPGI